LSSAAAPGDTQAMKDQITYSADGNATMFIGRGAVNLYAITVLASALRFYDKTAMRVTRAYTPTAMMRAARGHLGEAATGIKAREYSRMADALTSLAQAEKARIDDSQ
jgi:hypothetical protein